ncbi:MAG: IS110 family transposase [Burkholderia sp.]|jgi:transposase
MSKSTRKPTDTATATNPQNIVEAVYSSAIGVDVHCELLVCCFQYIDAHSSIHTELRSFGTRRSELEKFAGWCRKCRPETIVMESTGVLWKSPYAALESVGFNASSLTLVNARDVKAAIGRKTDRQDARRLAELARMGTLKKSFIPPPNFRLMRELARRYQKLKSHYASHVNALHKLMDSSGFRAASVFSDIRGTSATNILRAKIFGEGNFEQCVEKNSHRLRKATPEEIIDALNFDLDPLLRAQIADEMLAMDQELALAKQTMLRLAKLQAPYQRQIGLLRTIPGIQENAARLIFAELCDDLKQHFDSSEKFCSWMGICPGNNISANVRHSGHAAKGNKWLRRVLVECAHGVRMSKNSLSDRVMEWKLRRGTLRAIVAAAHLLARIIYSILVSGKSYIPYATDKVRALTAKRTLQNAKLFAKNADDEEIREKMSEVAEEIKTLVKKARRTKRTRVLTS